MRVSLISASVVSHCNVVEEGGKGRGWGGGGKGGGREIKPASQEVKVSYRKVVRT